MSMGFEGQAQSFWGVHLGGLFEGNQRETIHSGQLPNSDSGRIQPPSGSSLASLNQPERVGQDILQIRALSQMLETRKLKMLGLVLGTELIINICLLQLASALLWIANQGSEGLYQLRH